MILWKIREEMIMIIDLLARNKLLALVLIIMEGRKINYRKVRFLKWKCRNLLAFISSLSMENISVSRKIISKSKLYHKDCYSPLQEVPTYHIQSKPNKFTSHFITNNALKMQVFL